MKLALEHYRQNTTLTLVVHDLFKYFDRRMSKCRKENKYPRQCADEPSDLSWNRTRASKILDTFEGVTTNWATKSYVVN